jgi:hypothetical protein
LRFAFTVFESYSMVSNRPRAMASRFLSYPSGGAGNLSDRASAFASSVGEFGRGLRSSPHANKAAITSIMANSRERESGSPTPAIGATSGSRHAPADRPSCVDNGNAVEIVDDQDDEFMRNQGRQRGDFFGPGSTESGW